jgi:sugar lactone lactonase YvrE
MMAVGLVGSALASPARATTHLQLPQGVAVDTAGNIYVADAPGGSGSVFIYNVK